MAKITGRNAMVYIGGTLGPNKNKVTISFNSLNAAGVQQVIVYESRSSLGRYWYGNAWVTISEEIDVNNVTTISAKGTGDGALTRFPLV